MSDTSTEHSPSAKDSNVRMAVLLERVAQRLDAAEARADGHEERIRALDDTIRGTPDKPGLAIELDRIRQQLAVFMRILSWIGGGGLAGLAGTLYLLSLVLEAVRSAGAS